MNTKLSPTLTPPQKRFVEAFVRYGNLSKAIRIAYPEQSQTWSNKYQSLKGARMMENDGIKTEIETRKAVMEANATLGAQRIQTIIKEGKEHNALAASIFSVEQADGKATITQNIKSEHVSLIYDLSGGQGGAIPQEILDQLED